MYHVFVKKYPVSETKFSLPTKGIRTITAAWLPSILRDGAFSHDADKRALLRWSEVPWKSGMPMSATGFNRALEQISHYKYFFSLDATAFDSTIPGDVYEKVIARLRAKGFETHVVHDRIKRALAASYTAVQQGYLFDLLSGNIFHKTRGGATGRKGTTSDNSAALVALLLHPFLFSCSFCLFSGSNAWGGR